MLIAITYHYVRPSYSAHGRGVVGVTLEQMERQLALLGSEGTFVSGRDVLASVSGGRPLPAKSLLVTFDDGLREQYQWALPILNQMGIPALFFVNTRPLAEERLSTVHKVHMLRELAAPEAFVELLGSAAEQLGIDLSCPCDTDKCRTQYPYDSPEDARIKYLVNFALPLDQRVELIGRAFDKVFPRQERALSRELYMSREQLGALAANDYLGTHGHVHLPIGQLSPKLADFMISRSMECLERWTGQRPFAMSYPYGTADTCSPESARTAERHGLRLGFTVESAGNDAGSLNRPMFLGRFDCNLLPGGKRPLFEIGNLFESVPAARWYCDAVPERVFGASLYARTAAHG